MVKKQRVGEKNGPQFRSALNLIFWSNFPHYPYLLINMGFPVIFWQTNDYTDQNMSG